jgi:hypothetical protein
VYGMPDPSFTPNFHMFHAYMYCVGTHVHVNGICAFVHVCMCMHLCSYA